jgi:GH24 family phage-related lysozyme (muramidase)
MVENRLGADSTENEDTLIQTAIDASNYGVDGKGDFIDAVVPSNALVGDTTSIAFNITSAMDFLHACENASPRVHYRLGAKCKPGQVPGRDYDALDCSGFVREAVRRCTNLGNSFPDGSVVQHEWVAAHGFAPSGAQAGEARDGLVRIAFLPTTKTRRIGHVVLIYNAATLESHGGVGPDSRLWSSLGWRSQTAVFVLDASAQSVAGEPRSDDREAWEWLREATPIELDEESLASLAQASERALALIIYFEVTDQQMYERKYTHLTWAGGASGVTIGIGFDVGQSSSSELRNDWRGAIPDQMIALLERAVGVTGPDAQVFAERFSDQVEVPWTAANTVFRSKTVTFWSAILERALPNTHDLSPDCYGALLSLTYNRGASYSKPGDRFREMRAIHACMTSCSFGDIPAQILAMQRLWPAKSGLYERRAREADLFEAGLTR